MVVGFLYSGIGLWVLERMCKTLLIGEHAGRKVLVFKVYLGRNWLFSYLDSRIEK